jgi:hypothetical protein
VLHANKLHDAGNLAVEHRANQIGCDIARAKPGATGSEEHIDPLVLSQLNLLL